MNEFDPLHTVAIRSAEEAFCSTSKVASEWQALRFHSQPDVEKAFEEYGEFKRILEAQGAALIELPGRDELTLDAIYARDATIVTPGGMILCNMGRKTRAHEPGANATAYEAQGFSILGEIRAPGTLEGGDFIWLNENAAAIGLGPRTNQDGIDQLKELLGPKVELHIVPLPAPGHPEDVFHLMSMISPLDKDLSLIFRPLMPESFIIWLEGHGQAFVEVPEEEYEAMGCNVLALAPRKILMLDRLPQTKTRLQDAGCTVITYKGDEISRKGEGGPTCLTRPLIRRP
jgi:N-dimethylarginine dimethylaminohydrolase